MTSIPDAKRQKVGCDARNTESEAKELLEWLIHPIGIEEFYDKHWENTPLIVHRKQPDYYQKEHPMFTLDDLKEILKKEELIYGKNIDITNYREGNRITLNEPGKRVTEEQAMDRFEREKCTLRILHPQEFSDNLFKTCSLLQEWFGCVVGSNVYITPPDAQGFAPHYDDVDVFIIQVEGRKLWKLYKPLPEETLPETSSRNFSQDEIGECIQEVWLEQGDVMYFPRGVIHQALTDSSGLHSTHITISTVQKWTWYHYLVKALPAALRIAADENEVYRRCLPLQFQQRMGIMYSDVESEERNEFCDRAQSLAENAMKFLPFDAAADAMCVDYLHDSLPPIIQPVKEEVTVMRSVRLVSKSSVRITCEGESILFYYNTLNTRRYREIEPQFLEFPLEASEALEYLIHSFPKFIRVEELPLEFDEDKIEVCRALLASKIILIE